MCVCDFGRWKQEGFRITRAFRWGFSLFVWGIVVVGVINRIGHV